MSHSMCDRSHVVPQLTRRHSYRHRHLPSCCHSQMRAAADPNAPGPSGRPLRKLVLRGNADPVKLPTFLLEDEALQDTWDAAQFKMNWDTRASRCRDSAVAVAIHVHDLLQEISSISCIVPNGAQGHSLVVFFQMMKMAAQLAELMSQDKAEKTGITGTQVGLMHAHACKPMQPMPTHDITPAAHTGIPGHQAGCVWF